MVSIQPRAHVGPDGTLSLEVPTTFREPDIEVLVMLSAVQSPAEPSDRESACPPGFFEKTFGSFQDEPLERLPQGNAEVREPLR
jgi:hypothetical protein